MIFACVAVHFPGVSVLEDSEKNIYFFCVNVILYWENKKTKR